MQIQTFIALIYILSVVQGYLRYESLKLRFDVINFVAIFYHFLYRHCIFQYVKNITIRTQYYDLLPYKYKGVV